ncbi:gluconokinase [Leifsonia sp. P73]|uniref:gluconokinase n=1 Tax=Leifsonia sp. P73 TaxID=3423959 RepID=UPI003DA53952
MSKQVLNSKGSNSGASTSLEPVKTAEQSNRRSADGSAPHPVVLVLMGVSGSGKTTVAELLALRLGWSFQEGDALHPRENILKMSSGHPLNDQDRAPWLKKVADWVGAQLDTGQNGIITCSCLKRAYRDLVNRRGSGLVFVYLAGSPATIAQRLRARKGHFMPPALLTSQFADLEEPTADEPAIRVDVGQSSDLIAQQIVERLRLIDENQGG